MKKIIYLLSIVLFAAGCYYDIDVYHDPDFKPHLAAFSYIEAGQPFNVFVSKSDYPGEVDSNDIITNAQVEVNTGDGQVLYPDSASKGYYYFSAIGDQDLKITVKAGDMETSSEVVFPPVVDLPVITSIAYDVSWSLQMNNVYSLWYSIKLNVKIADDAQQENTYGVYLFANVPEFYFDTVNYVYTDSIIGYHKQDIWISGDGFSDNNYAYVDIPGRANQVCAFNDAILNGQEITVNIDYSAYKQVQGQPETDTVYCVFFSLSPDLYTYTKSLERYYETSDNPFAEPVDIYSNFSQGIGIAATYRVIDTIPVILDLQQ